MPYQRRFDALRAMRAPRARRAYGARARAIMRALLNRRRYAPLLNATARAESGAARARRARDIMR